ncbi:MAG: Xaa-Pro peptidase family protein [Candidatus Roizmanbacteria bacterium]|nr:Xaa-Pro peptidase family protein [Candidatus Roizmanbacteria bacterium]
MKNVHNIPSAHDKRIIALQEILEKKKIGSIIIERSSNIFYLTGYTITSETEREALLLVTQKKAYLAMSPLNTYDSPTAICNVLQAEKGNYYKTLLAKLLTPTKVYFENSMRHNEYLYLKKHANSIDLQPIGGLVESLRTIKDMFELSALKRADKATRAVLHTFLDKLPMYKTERSAAFALQQMLEKKTLERVAFTPIVASGIHSATPHHTPNTSKLSDISIVDCGARFDHYCADITRTEYKNTRNTDRQRAVDAVQEAYIASLSQIKVGMISKDAFSIAFDVLKKYNLHTYFIHSLGHGVGIDIHELPHLSPHSNEVLQNGMVFSIEPGVYIPGKFGVRYENTVVLTEKGCRELV